MVIVIELDGSQHLSLEHEKADIIRDKELNKLNLRVIRYTNDDIKNISLRFAPSLPKYLV